MTSSQTDYRFQTETTFEQHFSTESIIAAPIFDTDISLQGTYISDTNSASDLDTGYLTFLKKMFLRESWLLGWLPDIKV